MARLRRTNNVTVFTFEEKTRLTNFFMLLVEIDLNLPKVAKAKTKKCAKAKSKHRPTSLKLRRPGPIKESCYIKCPAMCCSARRDLFLHPFIRIFKGNKTNSMEYANDRHHCFIAYT